MGYNRLTRGTALVGAIVEDSITVGGGTPITKIVSGTASVNLPSILTGATGSATFTVTGADTDDVVVINPPSLTSGLAFAGAAVTSANTVTVYALNASGGTIDEAAKTFRYALIKFN